MFKYLDEFRRHSNLTLTINDKEYKVYDYIPNLLQGKEVVHVKMIDEAGRSYLGLVTIYNLTIKEIKKNHTNFFSKKDSITLSVLTYNKDDKLRLQLVPVYEGRKHLINVLEIFEDETGFTIETNGKEINPDIYTAIKTNTTLNLKGGKHNVRISGYS